MDLYAEKSMSTRPERLKESSQWGDVSIGHKNGWQAVDYRVPTTPQAHASACDGSSSPRKLQPKSDDGEAFLIGNQIVSDITLSLRLAG